MALQGDGFLRSCWVAGCGLLLGFRVFVFFGEILHTCPIASILKDLLVVP